MDAHTRLPVTRVDTLVQAIARTIDSGACPPGSRLPSIRQQARQSGVSPFTVVEAYERLVALGLVLSRRGSGFFVQTKIPHTPPLNADPTDLPLDEHWLLRNVYNQPDNCLPAGCGWLPGQWYDLGTQHRVMRTLARDAMIQAEYGDPSGYRPLRRHLALSLCERDIPATEKEILLTQGASSALNSVTATLARPGETLFVDDPGYCNLLSSLTFHGFNVVGVPWTPHGPDTKALEALLKQHRPKAYFTNPWLQNPTGASFSTNTAHQVLKLAEQYDFQLVEDNVSGELLAPPPPALAAMDGLSRVIYIGSFSKSLSPGLRVGFIAAKHELIEKLVRYKMMSGLTTPELNERITLGMLQESHYRKQMDRLRDHLAKAQYHAARGFDRLGWRLFTRPQNGLFLLAHPPGNVDSLELARQARQENILLAPGKLFRPYGIDTPWLRFNVAYCNDNTLWSFLERATT